MLWLFLKSSNNSSLLLNMKDNLSESCFQKPHILFGLWLHLLQHCCYQVARLIWVSIKWAHSCVIKLVNWRSCSCNSVAIELIVDLFMWHHHKWTSVCFCMHSACSMQLIFDLVQALLCNWTANHWTCSCDIITSELIYCLPVPHHRSWTSCTYSTLWAHHNCWLRSCSHNY